MVFNYVLAKYKFYKFCEVFAKSLKTSGYLLCEGSWLQISLFLFGIPRLFCCHLLLRREGIVSTKWSKGIREVQNESEALVFLAFQITTLMSVSVGHYFYSELFGVSTVVPILGFCGDGHLIKDHVGLNTFRNLLGDYL